MAQIDLNVDVVEVRDSEPLPLMQRVASEYEARYGVDPANRGGWYEADGWNRISRVFERLDLGGDLLDVGTGAGQFINCVALSGCFKSATTTDPTTFNKYIELSDKIVRMNESIADLSFDDKSFDVVTCMEVLEHLPDEIFLSAIAELRRVCRGQLVITVPYQEPHPISKTHIRRFEDEDLTRLFPEARFVILKRPNKPWVMIEEYPNGYPNSRYGQVARSAAMMSADVSRLRSENAKLRNRKALRAADWVGRRFRTAKSVVAKRIRWN